MEVAFLVGAYRTWLPAVRKRNLVSMFKCGGIRMQHFEQVNPGLADKALTDKAPADNASKADLDAKSCNARGDKVRTMLRARLGEDIFTSWFASMEFEGFDGRLVRASVPVKFLKNWIQSHYSDDLLDCCAAEFKGAERVELELRQPGLSGGRPVASANVAAQMRAKAADLNRGRL